MELALLTYNVFLLILYSIALTLAAMFYRHTKKPLYFYTAVLFAFFILDDLIIFMTEFIEWFADLYNQIFMSVPTCKTIIYAGTLFSMIKITTLALQRNKAYSLYGLLIICALIWLFVPILPDNAMKVYIYYLPAQVATLILSLYALYVFKKESDFFDIEFIKEWRRLAFWLCIFSILIVIEDTIVIFNFDSITEFHIAINNRNVSSDIMFIGYALFTIGKLIKMFQIRAVDETRLPEIPPLVNHSSSEASTESHQNTKIQNDKQQYSKFYLFCKEYQLTAREQDIFALLLKNKNNQEISEELVISIGTAKTHAHNIFQKVGVSKRQQLLEFYDKYKID